MKELVRFLATITVIALVVVALLLAFGWVK